MSVGATLQNKMIHGEDKKRPLSIPIENALKMEIKGFLKNLNLTGVVSHFIETNEQKILHRKQSKTKKEDQGLPLWRYD
jgi:hypothetical protein